MQNMGNHPSVGYTFRPCSNIRNVLCQNRRIYCWGLLRRHRSTTCLKVHGASQYLYYDDLAICRSSLSWKRLRFNITCLATSDQMGGAMWHRESNNKQGILKGLSRIYLQLILSFNSEDTFLFFQKHLINEYQFILSYFT